MTDHARALPAPAARGGPPAVPRDADTPLPRVRAAVAAARSSLEERFRRGEPVDTLLAARSRFTDDVLDLAWRRFGLDAHPGRALVAAGGYGRGELHPHSDVDLLILTRKAMRGGEKEKVKGFLAFLWDVGLAVGNSVRSVRECVDEARRDVTVATNFMDSRLVRGSAPLLATMHERTGPGRVWSSRRFFEAKLREQHLRHRRFDDTGYNLEPNVKEGPGGLRDVQTVAWVARRHFGAETLGELVDHGFLTAGELDALESGRRFLWRVRFALHVLTRRAEDRLLFDHQRDLAGMLGFEDGGGRLGVERLMKRYYREVMELSRLNEMLLEHFEEAILHARRRERVKPLNRRFQAVNGYVEVTREDVFRRCPFALLEVFLLLQQHPELEGVRASTIRLIRANRHRIDDGFRADVRARSLFLEILRQPRGLDHELRRMHRYGILGAYLPVFGQVAGQMQYDLFHAYTVDEHSLFVVRNLGMLADPARHDEHPHCADIFARLPKPELIYVAGLFHDVAKGRGGDHSEIGAELVREFCTRHGFGEYDTNLVAWLVRYHLLMSITAQRRDISDPAVVSEFAATVGDHVHLDYLYLLTVADIRGTNPGLWNDWKDALLHDLYRSTVRALLRGLDNPIERAELVRETRDEAGRLVAKAGIDAERAAELWDNFGDDYFLRHSADEIRWHTTNILDPGDRRRGRLAIPGGRRLLAQPPGAARNGLVPSGRRPPAQPPGDCGRPGQHRGRAGNGLVPYGWRRRPSRAGAGRARGHRDLRLRPGPEVPVRGQRLDPGAAGADGARRADHHRGPRHDPRFIRRRGRHGVFRNGVSGRRSVRARRSVHARRSLRARAAAGGRRPARGDPHRPAERAAQAGRRAEARATPPEAPAQALHDPGGGQLHARRLEPAHHHGGHRGGSARAPRAHRLGAGRCAGAHPEREDRDLRGARRGRLLRHRRPQPAAVRRPPRRGAPRRTRGDRVLRAAPPGARPPLRSASPPGVSGHPFAAHARRTCVVCGADLPLAPGVSTAGDRREERDLVTGPDRCAEMRVFEVHGHQDVVGDRPPPGRQAPRTRGGLRAGGVDLDLPAACRFAQAREEPHLDRHRRPAVEWSGLVLSPGKREPAPLPGTFFPAHSPFRIR